MKNFVKKLSAVITLVAMIASLGVCGYAVDTGAAITINGYEWSDVVNGVATVTVTYDVSNDTVGALGALGATMLTYAKGSADDVYADEDGVYDEDDTAYADTMQIVGIDQGAPKTLEGGVLTPAEADGEGNYATGTYVVQFPVALSSTGTSANGVQLGSGEGAVILIGGDNVTAPGAFLLKAPWFVDSVKWNGGGKDFGTIDVAEGTTEDAWRDKIESETIKWIKNVDNRKVDAFMNELDEIADGTITLNSLELTAEAEPVEGQANKYTVTVTIPAGTPTDAEEGQVTGIVSEGGVTFDVEVTAVKNEVVPVWEVEEEPTIEAINIELSEEDYAKTGAELNAAIKAALVKELFGDESELNLVLNVKKADEESTATVAITADDITVTSVTPGETMTYAATVEIPAGEYAVEGAEDKLVLDDDDIVIAVTGNVTKELGVAYGNVNGDKDAYGNDIINMQDAIAAMQIYKGTIAEPTEQQIAAADVNGVGGVNMQDAILIMQFYKNTISRFPVEGPVED